MNEMLIILLGIFFGSAIGLLIYFGHFWFKHQSKEKELDKLLNVIVKSAKEADEIIQEFKYVEPEEQEEGSEHNRPDLSSDKYLTTLITVIIKKFHGEVVLTANDFKNVSFDDYVTLFIDINNSDIILRSAGRAGGSEELSDYMMNYYSDEDVFH